MPKAAQRETKVIYALVDPRDMMIRYIGQTNCIKERFRCHVKDSVKRQPETAKSRWVGNLSMLKLQPQLVVLQVVAFAAADACERHWIDFGKRLNWPLLNVALNKPQLSLLSLIES